LLTNNKVPETHVSATPATLNMKQ